MRIFNYDIEWVDIDRAADYMPIVSTVTNLYDIYQKNVLGAEPEGVSKEHRFYSHIKDKSKLRCAVLLLPFLGNIAVAFFDAIRLIVKPLNSDQLFDKWRSRIDSSIKIKDPIKITPQLIKKLLVDGETASKSLEDFKKISESYSFPDSIKGKESNNNPFFYYLRQAYTTLTMKAACLIQEGHKLTEKEVEELCDTALKVQFILLDLVATHGINNYIEKNNLIESITEERLKASKLTYLLLEYPLELQNKDFCKLLAEREITEEEKRNVSKKIEALNPEELKELKGKIARQETLHEHHCGDLFWIFYSHRTPLFKWLASGPVTFDSKKHTWKFLEKEKLQKWHQTPKMEEWGKQFNTFLEWIRNQGLIVEFAKDKRASTDKYEPGKPYYGSNAAQVIPSPSEKTKNIDRNFYREIPF